MPVGAVENNDVDAIEDLLGGASDVALIAEGIRESAHSPLHAAAAVGHVKALRAMLSTLPSDFIELPDESGRDLLVLATQHDQIDVLRELLPSPNMSYSAQIATLVSPTVSTIKNFLGYEVRATRVNTLDAEQNSLVSLAARYGYVEVVAFLIEKGADVHLKNRSGQDALMCAVHTGSLDTVQLLVEAGADVHSRDRRERSVLHYAAIRQEANMVRYLIDEHGIDVNASDWEKRTPLFYVRDRQVAELFIDNGADVDHPDEYRQTPLMFAAWTGNKPLEQYLREVGANPTRTNARGRSADDMARARDQIIPEKAMISLAPMLVVGQHPDLE